MRDRERWEEIEKGKEGRGEGRGDKKRAYSKVDGTTRFDGSIDLEDKDGDLPRQVQIKHVCVGLCLSCE